MTIHTSEGDGSSHLTPLDNSGLNGNPDAFVFVTPNWGTSGPYDNDNPGVWYSGGQWYVFNQARSPLEQNAGFNVIGLSLPTQRQ